MGQTKPADNTKNRFIMLASLVSALCVVTLHTNGCFWRFTGTEDYWFSANIIECVCYFAVPVFFMISGATNLDYFDKYSTGKFYWKRIKKTVIPYVVWSLIGLAYLVYFKRRNPDEINIKYIIKGLSAFNIINLYWFFSPLFITYLCMPLFAAVQNDRKKTVFSWMVGLTFICNLLMPFIIMVTKVNYTFPMSVTVGSSYLIYIMLGYLLTKYDLKLPFRLLFYALAIAGLLVHIIGTYKLSVAAGTIIGTYKGYVAVPCLFYSIGIYIFIKQVSSKIKSEKFWKVIGFLGKYTFSLYLMQWFFLDYIDLYTKIDTNSLVYRLGAPWLIFAACILITIVLRFIPIVKWIVP